MIVAFALDYEAVTDKDDLLLVSNALKGLLKRWNTHGVLVCDGLDEIAGTVDRMPPNVKHRWQAALKQSRKGKGYWWRAGGTRWNPLHTINGAEAFNTHCAAEIQVACVTSRRADVLGVASDRESCKVDGVEVVRFPFAPDAEAFDRVSELSQLPIRKGTTTDVMWSDRFAPLARSCRKVAIVDRYVADDYRRFGRDSGIRRLLEKLSGIPTIQQVSIFTEAVADWPDSKWRAVVQHLPWAKSRCKIETVFLTETFFKKNQHARYIRFDHLRCVIDAGVQTIFGRWLGKQKLNKACEFSLKSDSEYYAPENNATLAGRLVLLQEPTPTAS